MRQSRRRKRITYSISANAQQLCTEMGLSPTEVYLTMQPGGKITAKHVQKFVKQQTVEDAGNPDPVDSIDNNTPPPATNPMDAANGGETAAVDEANAQADKNEHVSTAAPVSGAAPENIEGADEVNDQLTADGPVPGASDKNENNDGKET